MAQTVRVIYCIAAQMRKKRGRKKLVGLKKDLHWTYKFYIKCAPDSKAHKLPLSGLCEGVEVL